MAQQIYRTVTGNNAPDLTITCKRDGVAIDVTGATVSLIIRNERLNTIVNSGHQTCALTTPVSGIVTYSPVAGDFTTEDRYLGDIKIVYPNSKVEYLAEELLILARDAPD